MTVKDILNEKIMQCQSEYDTLKEQGESHIEHGKKLLKRAESVLKDIEELNKLVSQYP